MSKYDALGSFLRRQTVANVPMTFREVEKVTGTSLPSSKRYAAWWSNNTFNNVMTRVWLDAGFRTEQVDTAAEKLVFRRVDPSGMQESKPVFQHAPLAAAGGRHPIFGAMRGTFTIQPGYDLTSPALDESDLQALENRIEEKADLIEQGFARKD